MTRRYGGSRTSASRRALLPIVGAIPLAVAVTCSIATAEAAAQPGDPAPVLFEQLQNGLAQPGVPAIPAAVLDQAKNAAAAAQAAVGDGLHPVPVAAGYSDNATNLNVNSGAAGLIIGAVVGTVSGAVIGAVPGALIGAAAGAAIGGVAGGLAMGIPTLGVGAPIGIGGGALAGAGIGAVIGAVLSAIVAGVSVGAISAAVGYELGAATGIGNALQGG
ncbi:hypothetical protein ABZ412_11005 [Nocardia sp. NPDC005746]|uniref:hypothetical protein n=1 Tax=Nocardia sp. NPDC005746 TaxID=3157062 RepID=UPI0033FA6929